MVLAGTVFILYNKPMVREILKYPSPILKRKSEKVREINDEIKKLAGDMIETLKKSGGVGLAAPQIGESKRIIIVKTEAFINPEISKRTKETEIAEEGCLCIPGLYLKIKRAKKVEVKALDINGNKVEIKAEGLPARIFQHEIDHLDGILIINRIGLKQKLWRLFKS